MGKKGILFFIGAFFSVSAVAQFGGTKSFGFLNVPSHARLAAMGGVTASLTDTDVNLFMSNPALVSDSLAGMASASYTFYVADIGQAAFAYTHTFNKIGAVSFGVQHMNYGELAGYDATGAELGSFQSGETALVIGKSHTISLFRLGANVKVAFSNLAGFRSSALLLDWGGTFIHPTQDLRIGLVFKNLGFVLSEYSETSDTKVPFDVQVGATFKPEHMPVRITVTAYNLAGGDAYDDPDDEDDNVGTFQGVLQHVNFGAEVLVHRNVNVLLGYNVLKQQELKTLNTGGTGFTVGASLKIKSLDIVMSRSSYSIGQAAYAFTISANLNSMIFKKRSI